MYQNIFREKAKAEPQAAEEVLSNLNGEWRLIFTTGTQETQKKIKAKINYFPIKVSSSAQDLHFH